MTVQVYNHDSYAMASYADGVKAMRDEDGVLRVYSDRAKTTCIALHNANCWAYVTVSEPEAADDGSSPVSFNQPFPYQDGDVTVLGPNTFIDAAEEVISYKGENYRARNS